MRTELLTCSLISRRKEVKLVGHVVCLLFQGIVIPELGEYFERLTIKIDFCCTH